MTTISAFVERDPKRFSTSELLQIFADVKLKYGSDDLGLLFLSMHLELEEHIAELELKVARLEAKRK
jgi:hypothetical protein